MFEVMAQPQIWTFMVAASLSYSVYSRPIVSGVVKVWCISPIKP